MSIPPLAAIPCAPGDTPVINVLQATGLKAGVDQKLDDCRVETIEAENHDFSITGTWRTAAGESPSETCRNSTGAQ